MKKTMILLLALTFFFSGCKKDDVLKKGDILYEGYGVVDLGLPSCLLWATCNIGASSPEDYGDHFAWGETKSKSEYNNTNSETYGKYISDGLSGDLGNDVARSKWGGSWRMPTCAEFEELLEYCDLEMTEINGVNGCLVTGPNGNQIFLPAAGYINGANSIGEGVSCDYWSSTPESGYYDSYHLYLEDASAPYDMSSYNRYYGRSVRAVVNTNEIEGFTEDAEVYAGHKYVDLGLSVKWATCNVGAYSPEVKGDYYAWGEINTKDYYSESNNVTGGMLMDDISGNAQYDVARAKWGGDWRLPTKSEMQELIDNCTFTETTQNEVAGYKVTSKINGKSIFFPLSGYYYGYSGYGSSSMYCWSSDPGEDSYLATNLHIYSGKCSVSVSRRCYGQNVRAVF